MPAHRTPSHQGVTRSPSRALARGLLLSSLVLTGLLSAAPVLHEYFEPDPVEDLRLGATTPSGDLPAVLETPDGWVAAPQPSGPLAAPVTYGGAQTPTSADAKYSIDRFTSTPEEVPYDEPFRPSVLPFKRLYAFDAVHADLSLGVREKTLRRLTVGGVTEVGEDAFFGDLDVDLVQGVPVRIPSVGPGARLRSYSVDPPVDVEFLVDGADNWFVQGAHTRRVRLVVQLSWPRLSLASRFAAVNWQDLASSQPSLPENLRDSTQQVLTHLQLGRHLSPDQALTRLVAHFRAFSPSTHFPQAQSLEELYVEFALSQKGVCRHRAYTFLITAAALGFPTRFVHNEAHAWVEVSDGRDFHRIDLGGAPASLRETRPEPSVFPHRPLPDPFAWPSGSQTGFQLSEARTRSAAGTAWSSATDPSTGEPSGADRLRMRPTEPPAAPDHSDINLSLEPFERPLQRGAPLTIQGQAKKQGRPCALARVDVVLLDGGSARPLGSVATDRKGNFKGQVTLPADTRAGQHQVRAFVGAGCR